MKYTPRLKPIVRILNSLGGAVDRVFWNHSIRLGTILGALPLEVDKTGLDKLPEQQRSLYTEKDGKYRLEVDGVEDVAPLKGGLEAERKARKAAEKALQEFKKQFEGIDPKAVKEIMSRFDDKEEAELLKKGAEGVDELLRRRTQKMVEDYESQLEELHAQIDGALEVAGSYMDRVRDAHVLSAAAKAGVHPGAMDDVLLRAGQIFSVDDEGRAVQYENEGDEENERVVLGKDNKNPYGPADWLEEMKEKAPHWWPAGTSGGGASGNRGGQPTGAKVIKRSNWETMDHGQRMQKSKEGYQIVDG